MSSDKNNVSRRDFLKTTGIAAGTLVGGGLIGGLVGYNIHGKGTSTLEHGGHETTNEATGSPKAKMFLETKEILVSYQRLQNVSSQKTIWDRCYRFRCSLFYRSSACRKLWE